MEPRRWEVPQAPRVTPEATELPGHRRKLHDRLTEVCEDFVLEDLSQKYKQNTLVRELEYLLDY
jgi:hypothetical protein